ncbi:ankyrin repeat-containing domain protein [Trichoderma ceciliae]
MLDYEHPDLEGDPMDSNTYTLGTIGRHNVVIACLPSGHYGTNNAAAVASNMSHTFKSIRFRLMVGIGGGIPGDVDLRLGDVVVGRTVTQYDFGKAISGNEHECTGVPVRPPHALMTAFSKFQAKHEAAASEISAILENMAKTSAYMSDYSRPKELQDELFCTSYEHVRGMDDCRLCDPSSVMARPARNDDRPVIHFGDIASGNQVIKDAERRDRIARMLRDQHNLNIRSFEMEAAGIVDNFPCLVIRGICDYSDSHKNKGWQKYAAVTAAACAKEFISLLPVNKGESLLIPCTSSTGTFIHHIFLIALSYLVSLGTSPSVRQNELLESMKFPEIDSRHDNIKAAYAKTCQWLLCHPDYLCWLNPDRFDDHNGFLWIKGKPGAGKSTLMKFAYANTIKSQTAEHITFASFFFNARGSNLEKSTEGMYRSLIVQLLQRFPDLQAVLEALNPNFYAANQPDGWELDVLQIIFSNAVMKLGNRHLICFIDALDECAEDQIREMVEYFENLELDAAQKKIKVYICFSSRHYPHISIQVGLELTLEAQHGHAQDLEKYVLSRTRTWKGNIAKEVRDEILQKTAGIFMWVILVIPILNKEFENGRIFAVRDRLPEIPSELSDLFRDILRRDKDNLKDLILCLRWILFAKRPLRDDEFYFAMVSGLTSNSTELGEWDPDNIPKEVFSQFVLSSSKGLAEVTCSRDRSVQFIHESVRDFLIKDGGFHDLLPGLPSEFEGSSHDELKKCCYTYFTSNAQEVKAAYSDPCKANSQEGKDMRDAISRRFPFLEYATQFLLYHADAACAGHCPQMDFIRDFNLEMWISLDNLLQKFEIRKHNLDTSLLYILAAHGCANLIACRPYHPPWFNLPGGRYGYPILAAISNGHREAAKALICHGEPTTPIDDILACFEYGKSATVTLYGKRATTLLHWACQKGYVPFVKLLTLSGEFNIHRKDHEGHTPLEVAAIHGQVATIEYLLSIGVDIDLQRLLSLAVERHREDLAAFVLNSNPDAVNVRVRGSTLLNWACERGYINLAKLCLEERADPSHQDDKGSTPLYWAVYNNSYDITKILLENGADASMPGKDGQTLLYWAVYNNSYDITKILLENGADASMPGKDGYTLLFWAVYKNSYDITKILLENGADASTASKDGLLYWAVYKRSIDLIKILIENGADASTPDKDGHTPLYWAVYNNSYDITKILFEHGADASMPGKDGCTPLHIPTIYKPAIDVNMRFYFGLGLRLGTSLPEASSETCDVVRLLIEKGADIEALDCRGTTALGRALDAGHTKIIEVLLEKGADFSGLCFFKENILHEASLYGCSKLVKLLLQAGVSAKSLDCNGDTALDCALRGGHSDTIALLTEYGA